MPTFGSQPSEAIQARGLHGPSGRWDPLLRCWCPGIESEVHRLNHGLLGSIQEGWGVYSVVFHTLRQVLNPQWIPRQDLKGPAASTLALQSGPCLGLLGGTSANSKGRRVPIPTHQDPYSYHVQYNPTYGQLEFPPQKN